MSNLLRDLASSFETQIVYSRMKDGFPVEFFENKKDFTALQTSYMYWLEVYHGLYTSLSSDNYYLNVKVINNQIRCDAYLKCRAKLNKEMEDRNQPINNTNNVRHPKRKTTKMRVPGIPTVCYRPNK